MLRRSSRVTLALALLLCPVFTACGSSESDAMDDDAANVDGQDDPQGGNGDDATLTSDDGSEPSDCMENPLFAAQPYGDNGTDMIRRIERDADSGDLYFSVLNDMYVLRDGATTPELLGPRPNDDLYGRFWLAGDRILFPTGALVPLIEGTRAVLYSTDRNLGDLQIVVGTPVRETDNEDYEAGAVSIVGDDVIWLGLDKQTDNPARIPGDWQTTYVLRRTSWKQPGEPEDIYSTTRFVRNLTLAGNTAFIEEQVTEEDPVQFEQTVVDLNSGAVSAEFAQVTFGGDVVGGDTDSLFVARVDLENPENIGLFRVAPDASGSELVTTNPFIDLLAKRGDAWLFVDPQTINDPIVIGEYTVGGGVRQLGCVDGRDTTVHALALSNDTPLIAVFRGNQSTIMSVEP